MSGSDLKVVKLKTIVDCWYLMLENGLVSLAVVGATVNLGSFTCVVVYEFLASYTQPKFFILSILAVTVNWGEELLALKPKRVQRMDFWALEIMRKKNSINDPMGSSILIMGEE